MANALAATKIHPPAVPLVANVLAAPLTDPTEIRQRLVEQVTGTVRWRESMAWLGANGVTRFVEIGAGKVLTGLAKRIVPGVDGSRRRHAGRGAGARGRAAGIGEARGVQS